MATTKMRALRHPFLSFTEAEDTKKQNIRKKGKSQTYLSNPRIPQRRLRLRIPAGAKRAGRRAVVHVAFALDARRHELGLLQLLLALGAHHGDGCSLLAACCLSCQVLIN